jgi:hypothetical protein
MSCKMDDADTYWEWFGAIAGLPRSANLGSRAVSHPQIDPYAAAPVVGAGLNESTRDIDR